MGLRVFVCQCACAFATMCLIPFSAVGQSPQPTHPQESPARQTPRKPTGNQILPSAALDHAGASFSHSGESYQMSSRIHLQRGADTGYLVVRVDLEEGSHIYSLTQTGDIGPTKIEVAKTRQFQLTGKFTPDIPPEITEFDPIFEHRVEKHTGVVQFFAPIRITRGTDSTKLNATLTINGQVCTDDNICMPIAGVKITGKFAGYFERTAKKQKSPQKTPPRTQSPIRSQ